ncbi:phosphoenolpyruvate carboxykinase [Skermanella mucosa]|uniref:phosphoenolpyruvate carboxykinase n=1 Tax=Skermanella mucosa TaxID=1789672 RepID=UPI00192B2800|nr:phosphoenolpyruvate carboxykinase [Skermanella mucosa]UEM20559.1 phosphoenolpyruvate carboxykinase [Skermanella mucosa]
MTVKQFGPTISSNGLDYLGLSGLKAAHWNYSAAGLYEQALVRGEATLAKGGPLVAITGQHTGRSPNDKFIVQEDSTSGDIWWGNVNKPITEEQFDRLHGRVAAYLQGREVFVQDLYAGADPEYRLPVRIVTQHAWHNLFARNMFIRPSAEDRMHFAPEFTVLQVPDFKAVPERDGTRSDVFILCNFAKRLILVGGTSYAGEIKKGIFSVMNYLLPARGVLPMHCSANIGPKGDTAVFFGLSGTGKTTLSADGSRTLIGDDEHGWSETSIFNFEGGCYAKVIRLSAQAEPEIYATTSRFGTILENVVMDPETRVLDLDDGRYTENTRASYPLDFIPNVSETGIGGIPQNIVMLTADAFGVLPPISKLTPDQAMYHFLSGYTARVAGTEKGVTEPQATFSTCFGAPFMPRHPAVYAKLLGDKIAKHGSNVWLVNTGWSGGAYGTGKRMSIGHTRSLIRAALEGNLADAPHRPDPNFGLFIPEACPDVPADVLQPKNTWSDKRAYDETAHEVAKRFEANFKQFADEVEPGVRDAAIKTAA